MVPAAAKAAPAPRPQAPPVDSMWRAQQVLEYAAGCIASARKERLTAAERVANLDDAEVSAQAVADYMKKRREARNK